MVNEFDLDTFLKHLTQQPGVYRMYDSNDDVIYVGKAKNLKKRVTSYFRKSYDNAKTAALVSHIARIDTTVVTSETEAFLLENNFIKKYRPRYNVVLRDDKSYPFIHLSEHKHPKLGFHRGGKKQGGEFFGPYPSAWSVRQSLKSLQSIFPVRQCEDSYYRARSRPCLQYQMKRCSAPCVEGHVSDQDYAMQVELLRLFLRGKNKEVVEELVARMEKASAELNFETAARFRDQIAALKRVQERQIVAGSQHEMDVFGHVYKHGEVCIQGLFVRENQLLGSKSYFPKIPAGVELSEILTAFILQFYLAGNKAIPKQIVVPFELDEQADIEALLSKQAGRQVFLYKGVRDEKRQLVELAISNAQNALNAKLVQQKSVHAKLLELERVLELEHKIQRIECFDISHTSGTLTVASNVVFDREGPLKSNYRKFNIDGITPGDDYAAMAQALQRRFKSNVDPSKVPDVLLIDGGKGQLTQAEEHFNALSWPKKPLIVGVAKGVSRRPGLETLIIGDTREIIDLAPDSVALHLIQQVRDEAHRFAITGHRERRQKQVSQSSLQDIPGIGPKRRQQLLKYTGGLRGLKKCSVGEIAQVPGISQELAQQIYDYLHNT